MFVALTVATLFSVGIGDPALLTRRFEPHALTSLALFAPVTPPAIVIWVVWALAFLLTTNYETLSSALGGSGFVPVVGHLRNLSASANMGALDHAILVAGIVLALHGWLTGTAITLVFGMIVAVGMVGVMLEQR